ncbi:putative sodium/calcium exchanger 7 (Na(+)/Ca(2+)-exchange protein 7) [Aphelenchoides besseyi]|nr:putative sodium/calcium exchanger 7 (Na(+)/Ca(2+)-exchange protein 7) [Aphelenchoides besseyi]
MFVVTVFIVFNLHNRMSNNFTVLESQKQRKCTPFSNGTIGSSWSCGFVRDFSDECEGGGYIAWTEIVICEKNSTYRWLLIILAVLLLFYLFIMISTAADDFFSRNIATIIDEHQISQSTAGVTFLAFGNGAPDIFSSIASVTSAKRPKANLAVAELLGGGMFVTSIVVSCIIFVKPFQIPKLPFLRDTLFFVLALCWLAFVLLFSHNLYTWEPVVFLVIYILYALTVVFSKIKKRSLHKIKPLTTSITELRIDHSNLQDNKNDYLKPPPTDGSQLEIERAPIGGVSASLVQNGPSANYSSIDTISTVGHQSRRSTISRDNVLEHDPWTLPTTQRVRHMTVVQPRRISHGVLTPKVVVELAEDTPIRSPDVHNKMYLEQGKFFSEAETDEEVEEINALSIETLPGIADPDILPTPKGHRALSVADDKGVEGDIWTQLKHTAVCLNPIDREEFVDKSFLQLVLAILRVPCIFFFKLTIPQVTDHWCKGMAVLHVITAPQSILLAFQIHNIQLSGGFYLWMLVLGVSVIVQLLVIVFTSAQRPPLHYRKLLSYIGFVSSTAWIFAIAAEVVNVVLMIGIISTVSFDILGLTLIAWSNSLGDLVADISVARRGFPKMAISAAFAGPLFTQGKKVTIEMNSILRSMVIFLAIGIISSIVILTTQRFNARRFHSVYLIIVYTIFIVVVILSEIKII